jgi:Baseplate J-like protein
MNMNGASCTCGCCEGVQVVTPSPVSNPPGLPALSYRVGTHGTFLETMIARLSSADYPALAGLKTRDPGDFSIALLDSWATVADILTFYQERIANEGCLRTATERFSILQMAQLIGYALRPGVASSVYLAFTLSQDNSTTPPTPTESTIPQGTLCQSVPGPGESAQFFETSEDLDARSAWNDMQPRLTRPQDITVDGDFETDAATRDTLYFDGISTNLNTGDALLIVFSQDTTAKLQFLRVVESITVQADQNRTEAILQPKQTTAPDAREIRDEVKKFYKDAVTVYVGNEVSDQLAIIVKGLQDSIEALGDPGSHGSEIAALVQAAVPQLTPLYNQAVERNFTRLAPWLAQRIADLTEFVEFVETPQTVRVIDKSKPLTPAPLSPSSPLGNLGLLIKPLSLPPSLQPANSARLPRTVQQTLSPQSDMAAKLLSKLIPAAAPLLYPAWKSVQAPVSQAAVNAFRVKASLFSSSFAGASSLSQFAPGVTGTVILAEPQGAAAPAPAAPAPAAPAPATPATGSTTTTPPTLTSTSSTTVVPPILDGAWDGAAVLSLDAVYDTIVPGSWIAIRFPKILGAVVSNTEFNETFHKVVSITTASVQSVSATLPSSSSSSAITPNGFTAKVTQLKLDPHWQPGTIQNPSAAQDITNSTAMLRQTVVYAQAEELDLAEEPLDIDIEGDTIELDDVYDGLESGRWIIVSGERTDIPNVTGVSAAELVMIAGVEQGSRTLFCAQWPPGGIAGPPFKTVFYITPPNTFGDQLLVGQLGVPLSGITPASALNQQYCDQVELAAGLWVNAYVPSSAELQGDFSAFEGLLIDPGSGAQIPTGTLDFRIQSDWGQTAGSFWAWRINSAQPHTILTLANDLAYAYDASTVTIYGNVVSATNGATINEVLGSGDGSQTYQQFTLKQTPVTFTPATNPSGVDSSLKVYVNNVEWEETATLDGLGPKARNFITTTDNNANMTVTFGDGAGNGARLPTGTRNVTAIYRMGIGTPGNVEAGQISLLQSRPLNVQSVVNPLGASGGADADTLVQARANAPLQVMSLDRLVSVQDYADFSRTFAGIGKASSTRLSNGQQMVVYVTIAGAEDIPIDVTSSLYLNLVQALLVNGDPNEPIQVAVRKLKLLVIVAQVSILSDYLWESVVADLRAALLAAFSFDTRDLGQPVFQSEVISAVQAVDGVAYVDLQNFDSVPEDVTVAQLAGLAGSLKLRSYIEVNLARINPDPTADPASSILPAELAYLTPDVPDTLILNQVTS